MDLPFLKGKIMDDGRGNLVPIGEEVAKEILMGQEKTGSAIPSVFRVGEILQIKGSHFQIQSMGRKKMKLKILTKP